MTRLTDAINPEKFVSAHPTRPDGTIDFTRVDERGREDLLIFAEATRKWLGNEGFDLMFGSLLSFYFSHAADAGLEVERRN